MSKNAVITAIAVCLMLAVAGAGILGWMWISRDRAAVASYRVELTEETRISDLVAKESELMKSTEVLQPVIGELDLLTRWELTTEEEALARLRSKLTVKPGSLSDRIKVVYRDRSQDRALEILGAINRRFEKARQEAADNEILPRVAPSTPVGP